MKNLLLNLFLILAFASCKTLEEKCRDRFPTTTTEVIRETTHTDTIILPWHTVEIVDTTVCPPATEETLVIKTITKELPGDTIYYEVQCIDTVMLLRDQPKVNYLTAEVSSLEKQLAATGQQGKTRMWVIIALSLLCAGLLYLLFRRRKT